MKLNGAAALVAIVSIGAALLAAWQGWLDWGVAISVVMGGGALLTLLSLLRWPWNLYFSARSLAREAVVSKERGVEHRVDPAEARRMARRLLLVCFGLHLTAAAACAAAAWFSEGQVGWYFAGSFLLSTGFRPGVAFFQSQSRRLAELHRQVRYPRNDVISLRDRVEALETRLERAQQALADAERDRSGLRAGQVGLSGRLDDLRSGTERTLADHEATLERRTERILREFSRSVERLTDDRALLAGVRAFVRLVREESAS